MVNICLITNGSRPRLLEQTLLTLIENTSDKQQFNLTIVFDGVHEDSMPGWLSCNKTMLGLYPPCYIVGRLKNLGAYWSEKQFGRGEWLCFLDDDMALFPGWLEKMTALAGSSNQLRLLGGVRHPFHGVNIEQQTGRYGWQSTDAVAGYCHFMRWSIWDKFGPYDAHAQGTGQSEDFAFSRKIVDVGGKVGYIHPPVMAHTGITDSSGKTILGANQIERVPGYLYE